MNKEITSMQKTKWSEKCRIRLMRLKASQDEQQNQTIITYKTLCPLKKFIDRSDVY